MKHLRLLVFVTISSFCFAASMYAQDKPVGQPETEAQADRNQPVDARANMLRQLGLSREQIQRLRRVNMERKPFMDAAQARLRQATRALDEAIYADQLNESDVQARLKDMQLAQAEVFRIRFMNEIAVRRLLTLEQLVRFRNLRQRFERSREAASASRPEVNQPVRNLNTRPEKPY